MFQTVQVEFEDVKEENVGLAAAQRAPSEHTCALVSNGTSRVTDEPPEGQVGSRGDSRAARQK